MPDFSIVNPDMALRVLRERLNEDLLRAAEPLIQQALKDVEASMRKALSANLVGLVEGTVFIERGPREMTIRVVLDPNKADRRG